MPRKPPPLSETHPEVAAHWVGNVGDDPRTPDSFSIRARLECQWWCGTESHPWFTSPPGHHDIFFRCPHCTQDRLDATERALDLPVADVPMLVEAWADPRPFDGLVVRDLCDGVMGKNYGRTYSLRCSNGHKIDTVVRRFYLNGCPWCRGNATRAVPPPSLAEDDPEVCLTFHPTLNGDLTPETTPANHRAPLWWKSMQCCGHEWQETLTERVLGRRPQAGRGHWFCPRCESVFGSLAWLDPELAAEWHDDNDLTPWHVKPFSGGVVVRWRCLADPSHEWDAAVADRSAGRLCPFCSTAGTSRIEQAFLAAAQQHDAAAEAARVGRWRVDVLMPTLGLVVEYDGSYWHADKFDLDLRKSRALIDAGYLVARVRENDLAHLDHQHPGLHQLTFWPAHGDVDKAVESIVRWATTARPAPLPGP